MSPYYSAVRDTLLLSGSLLLLIGCGRNHATADAYGNFEATETVVSAKGSGELLAFRVEEGMRLLAGTPVGLIDTTQLALQLQEVLANRDATAAQARNTVAAVAVQEARLADLQREEKRLVKLVAGKAATQKQLDDMRGQITVQEKQVAAAAAGNPSIVAQVRAFDARAALLREQIADQHIVNPVNGTVVSKLMEPHELAVPGRALYRIAKMDTLELRAYINGAHLSAMKVGGDVNVGIDRADSGVVRLPGRISWISSVAEFTPKTIQTQEERVDLVYAFKVRVANTDGLLKSGMPGEVYLERGADQEIR
jgi:HlyD family secretion protein